MVIADRLRMLREEKQLSQGEVEERTGLLRCYISRVEHGNTVPSVETLEKFAHAFEMKLYQLLYDGPNPPKPIVTGDTIREWGHEGPEARRLWKLQSHLAQMNGRDRALLMALAVQIARLKGKNKPLPRTSG